MNHLRGRRIQISGSANAGTAPDRIRYAHALVRDVAVKILRAGGGLVIGIGKEPKADSDTDPPGLTFDWTILEAAARCFAEEGSSYPEAAGLPLIIVTSEKGEASIPSDRIELWRAVLHSQYVAVQRIRPGSTAGALVQQRQGEVSDALVLLGGGAGVEHSAELFERARRTVLPLDLSLGASRNDGTGGAERLSKEAHADPARYLRLDPSIQAQAGARLAAVSTRGGGAPFESVAIEIVELLQAIDRPVAFYTRLLARDHNQFDSVEKYFRNVVDPVVEEAGFRRIEVGTDRAEHGFMNVDIFRRLHYASLAVTDVTGLRPNCFLEMGYALGRGIRVLVTAQAGTELPFDQEAIPCRFWNPSASDEQSRAELRAFWQTYIDRGSLVE